MTQTPLETLRRPNDPPARDRWIAQQEINQMLEALDYADGQTVIEQRHKVTIAFCFRHKRRCAIEKKSKAASFESAGFTKPEKATREPVNRAASLHCGFLGTRSFVRLIIMSKMHRLSVSAPSRGQVQTGQALGGHKMPRIGEVDSRSHPRHDAVGCALGKYAC